MVAVSSVAECAIVAACLFDCFFGSSGVIVGVSTLDGLLAEGDDDFFGGFVGGIVGGRYPGPV